MAFHTRFGGLRRWLKAIYQRSYSLALIPEHWRMSRTILIYKKGDIQDPGNWRPIALQNSISKIYTADINKVMRRTLTNDTTCDEHVQRLFSLHHNKPTTTICCWLKILLCIVSHDPEHLGRLYRIVTDFMDTHDLRINATKTCFSATITHSNHQRHTDERIELRYHGERIPRTYLRIHGSIMATVWVSNGTPFGPTSIVYNCAHVASS
ncbi:hypothetical protein O0I10_009987 [Lichtheimia ornata]|uniref:Reverse transcriptase domain-containing protein n=1 Tax=Lichtheimia ornata TaxID=688661 RepID=A0AAD7XY61_9FUNG|nr:uncharacterized protein O0I10_009987 [Lichtheimia ornata]KAJ8654292.1 hypothetical protein O0I10_009987 [Lichtheimia ornata]